MKVDNTSSHRLLGKFFTNSVPPSFEETEQSLRKQWVLTGDMIVQKLDEDSDTFLFEFKQKKDREEVIIDEPYYVNGVILVLKDPESSKTIDFTVATFLVVVPGLPSYFLSKKNIQTLQTEVGASFNLGLHGKVAYFEVEVDLKKPLRPGYYLTHDRFVAFKYLNLGDFCYSCGMIGHVKENCDQVKFPKERSLNATSTTHVYGPWLRLEPFIVSYETSLMKSRIGSVLECEKTLSHPQFCIEIEFNNVFACNPRVNSRTESTHRFRFPCSYLVTETESTSKAYEVIRREIYENAPFSLDDFEDKSNVIASLVERLKLIQKNEFCSDDKWLTLKLQINKKHMVTPVDYETMLADSRDLEVQGLMESKLSDLIKRRVEQNTNLLSLSLWERDIRQLFSAVEFTHHLHLLDVSKVAYISMLKAVRMEISSSKCPIPADKNTVSNLKHFNVLGPDMDRLDRCMICVGEMFLAEESTILPCSHGFHNSCIGKWLEVECPLCRFKLPTLK